MVFNISATLLVLLISYSKKPSLLNNSINAKILFYLLFISATINIVLRDLTYIDTLAYTSSFTKMRYLSFTESFQFFGGEKLFNVIVWLTAQVSGNPRVFLLVICCLFLLPFLKTLNKLFLPWQATLMLFTYLNFPFFVSYTQNTIRQGVALALFMYAIALWLKHEKSKKYYFILLVTPFIHWACLPFSLILFFSAKIKLRLRVLYGIWGVLAIFFITNLNISLARPFQKIIPNLGDYTGSATLMAYGGKVNRIDFLLFSAFLIALVSFLYFYVHRDETYKNMIKIYVMFNSVFLLLGFVAFSDRIAIYSWFLAPLLLWYPILKSKKELTITKLSLIVIVLIIGYVSGSINYYNPFNLLIKS